MSPEDRLCLGVILGAHGVRGGVRIKPFTDRPEDVAAYGPVSDDEGARQFVLTVTAHSRGQVVARIDGVKDRDAAEALKGVQLYVSRQVLPPPAEDEFYHADLLGLRVEDRSGRTLGTVAAVHDFGAGDLLDVTLADGGSALVPFTKKAVPEVDLAGGRIVVDPPPGVLDTEPARPARRPRRAPR